MGHFHRVGEIREKTEGLGAVPPGRAGRETFARIMTMIMTKRMFWREACEDPGGGSGYCIVE